MERPAPSTDGIYVIALNKKVPSRIPSLEEIHARVLADYKYAQAMQIARESGRVFTQMITNQLAQVARTTTDALGKLKPGTYPFRCKYHFAQGMIGVLTVSG